MRDDSEGPPPKAPSLLGRREAWELVAERVDGELVEDKVPGGFAVDVEHGPWTLRLDLHMVSNGSASLMHTRVWTRFFSRDELRLVLRPKTFFDRVLERLGRKHPELSDREVARRYAVRGRPRPRIRSLLSGGLAETVTGHDSLRIRIGPVGWWRRRSLGRHARLMEVLAPRVDTDADRMVELIRVGRETLDVLRRTGSASAERLPGGRS